MREGAGQIYSQKRLTSGTFKVGLADGLGCVSHESTWWATSHSWSRRIEKTGLLTSKIHNANIKLLLASCHMWSASVSAIALAGDDMCQPE